MQNSEHVCTTVPQPTHQPQRQRTDTTLVGYAILLIQPFARTDFAKRSFRCAAPSVWNSLPASVIGSDSLSVLKSRLNIFTIQDCRNILKFSLPSDLLAVRYATFSNRYRLYKNLHWYFGLK